MSPRPQEEGALSHSGGRETSEEADPPSQVKSQGGLELRDDNMAWREVDDIKSKERELCLDELLAGIFLQSSFLLGITAAFVLNRNSQRRGR